MPDDARASLQRARRWRALRAGASRAVRLRDRRPARDRQRARPGRSAGAASNGSMASAPRCWRWIFLRGWMRIPGGPRWRCAPPTLSLLALKPGLFTAQGRDAAGEVWFEDLQIACDGEPPTALLAGPPARQRGSMPATRPASERRRRHRPAHPAWPVPRCWPRAPRCTTAPAACSSASWMGRRRCSIRSNRT